MKTIDKLDCRVDYCGLSGATAFLAALEGAKIIINGSRYCYFWSRQFLDKCYKKELEKSVFCSALNENSIVFGTEPLVKRALKQLLKGGEPQLLAVINNCTASLIGDDLHGIAQEVSCPVIFSDIGGIQGDFIEGYQKMAEAYLDSITQEKLAPEPMTVNLLGANKAYHNAEYDVPEIIQLLERFGVKINCALGYDFTAEEAKSLSRAQLNIVLHEELGLGIAQKLENELHIPYLVPALPYGLEGTEKWLLQILKALHADLEQEVNTYFAKEKAELSYLNARLEKAHGELWFDQICINARTSVAQGLADALRKELVNYGEMVLNIYGEKQVKNPCDFEKSGELLLLGSSLDYRHFVVAKARFAFIGISYPNNDDVSFGPYMGVAGARHLLEKLWAAKLSLKHRGK